MSDDVAAVLVDAVLDVHGRRTPEEMTRWKSRVEEVDVALTALTAAGYAIVKLPEGVAVAHGARLVYVNRRASWFAIEDTP